MDDIDRFLKEDMNKEGDITSKALFTTQQGKAKLITHEPCVIAGLEEAKEVFYRTGVSQIETLVNDGESIPQGTTVLNAKGSLVSLLTGERLALNFICRMSGIATETKKLVDICSSINPQCTIAATRKTTPGFRKYEKKAVVLGGGEPHRFGLYDAFLIKDNHIQGVGSLTKAIQQVQKQSKRKIIEVEVETREQATQAAHLGVDCIMLDNFHPEEGKKVADCIKEINPSILIEVSGGITRENIASYASFADRISLGYLTHSVRSIDFSLDVAPR